MPKQDKPEIKLIWEMTCHQCRSTFEVEVPRGPKQEKELRCLQCGSQSIERIQTSPHASPSCGG